MKTNVLIAMSLSLTLAGCSSSAPLAAQAPSQPGAAARPQAVAPRGRESLRIKLPDFGGFSTKAAFYQDLDRIQFRVTGEGISNSEANDTEVVTDLDDADLVNAEVSIRDIPAEDGAWRIVTAVGLDEDGNELPAFTAKAVFISDEDSTTDVSFSRETLLLGLAFEELIRDGADVLEDLDEDDLEDLESELGDMLDYTVTDNRFRPDGSDFWFDPLDYDPVDVAEAIDDGSLLDGDADFTPNGPFAIDIELEAVSSGTVLSEDVVVTIDDPRSQPVAIPAGTTLANAVSRFIVSPGTWSVVARDPDGDELDTIGITVDQDGDLDFTSDDALQVPAGS